MMKQRKKLAGILSLVAVLMFSGCGADGGIGKRTKTGDSAAQSTTEYHFLEETNKSGSAGSADSTNGTGGETESEDGIVVWNDNSLDDFTAVINHSVKREKADGEINTRGSVFVSEVGCVCHGDHAYTDYKKDWDGVNGMTVSGGFFSTKIEVDPERQGNQIDTLAPISGKEGYVAYTHPANFLSDVPSSEYWFYEMDETFQLIRKVQATIDSAPTFFNTFLGDAAGNYHVLYKNANDLVYAIFSSEGKGIFEKKLSSDQGTFDLLAFGGGRVALCELIAKTNEYRISVADTKTSTLSELACSKDEKVRNAMRGYISAVTPIDDYRIAWCAQEGICVYDTGRKEIQVVYRWSNHGLIPTLIRDMTVTTDGSVSLLYNAEGETGLFWLLLKPTVEKKELASITIAVDPRNKRIYEKAATIFKKKYPNYVIDIQTEWDKTVLLAKLGAGEGPVLVDTMLTGFENLEKLWQPLDGFLEQTHLAEELIPEALEFGKIGDVTYGIVSEFYIETLLVREDISADWNYEGFLNILEKNDGAVFTSEDIREDSIRDWRKQFFGVLQNGLEDSYYLNNETGETIFGSPEFDRVLNLAAKAEKCTNTENGKTIKEGRALCEYTGVYHVQQAIRLRRQMEARGEKAIGFPTKNGARHLLVADDPIAMRVTATEEEKEIAYTFLNTYLSQEVVSAVYHIPVRKDVFEEDFQGYEEMVEVYRKAAQFDPDIASNQDLPDLDWDKDVKFVEDLIHGGVVKKSLPAGLQQVFDEELSAYLRGQIDGKALSDHLRSRVGLYLAEQR